MKKEYSPVSYIELSRKNLLHNVGQFRHFAKAGTEFAVALKGNAYGHGQNEVAKIIAPHVDYLQVNSIEELELLRKITKKQTFVLGYVQKSDLNKAVKLGCILAVFSLEQLDAINKIAGRLGKVQEVHIPVDAFLGREGFALEELPEVFKQIQKSKAIKMTGIYAHFANIEDTRDFSHAQKQINQYKLALELTNKFGFKNFQSHISATSGLLVYEKSEGIHPLVRLGIGVYGMWPSKYLKSIYKNMKFHLKPVMTWKTKVAKIRVLPKGATIGYGLTYKTKIETKVAIIAQGYADGLDRGFSNNGFVLINGTRCKILGRVHMNMSAVDVSHLSRVKLEDEVVILGKQGREHITAEEMADRVDTINYEITTRISPLLPRIVV